MSEHHAKDRWQRTSQDYTVPRRITARMMAVCTGTTVPASAAKEYRGDPDGVNPEEALVAALSSCHMLTFLAIADEAEAVARFLSRRRGGLHGEERGGTSGDHARDPAAEDRVDGGRDGFEHRPRGDASRSP
jgi:organic hydroperoxide reductase OsmC/OhrA